MKRGKGLADLPDAERHKLRIALKNLRYAAEFFGGLFANDAAEPYVDALARLQDLLGAHNDEVNAMRLLRDMDETTGARTAKAHGIVLGWHARGKARADAELYKCWRRFKRREMFWR
jgi:CHAD domain-containing protein